MVRQRLGDLLQEVMRRHHLDDRVRQRAAMGLWPEVVGADIARNAWPLGVRDRVLVVGASNHAWVQTLHLMRAPILEALNARIGGDVLRELQVRVARRERPAGAESRPDHGPAQREPLPPLTRAEQQRVRDLTAAIEDPALREKVGRAVAGLMRLRRLRQAQGWRQCSRCGRSFVGRGRVCPGCVKRR